MVHCGSLWFFTIPYWSLWILVVSSGFWWSLIVPYGYFWFLMTSYSSLEFLPKGFLEASLWFLTVIYFLKGFFFDDSFYWPNLSDMVITYKNIWKLWTGFLHCWFFWLFVNFHFSNFQRFPSSRTYLPKKMNSKCEF